METALSKSSGYMVVNTGFFANRISIVETSLKPVLLAFIEILISSPVKACNIRFLCQPYLTVWLKRKNHTGLWQMTASLLGCERRFGYLPQDVLCLAAHINETVIIVFRISFNIPITNISKSQDMYNKTVTQNSSKLFIQTTEKPASNNLAVNRRTNNKFLITVFKT